MTKNMIKKLEKNQTLKNLVKKPIFLTKSTENKLIKFIEAKKIEEFYNLASKLIKNSRDVNNLYTYIINKLELQGIENEVTKKLKNHLAEIIFNISFVGWLKIPDPELIKYSKMNTTDKQLLDEIKKTKTVRWFPEYLKCIKLENQISNNCEDIEKNVLKYYEEIKKLYKKKKIKKREYEMVLSNLQKETSIFKGGKIIGALISAKLQAKLEFKWIMPKLIINKVEDELLLD
jgi:hypothetical protein